MTRARLVLALCAGLLVWPAAGPPARAADIAALQRQLHGQAQPEYRFDEVRESPWQPAPMRTQGRLRLRDGVLEKIVESPRRETWRLLPDRLQLLRPGLPEAAEIRFGAAPAVGVLAGALRRVLAGDLAGLGQTFELVLSGDERHWTLHGVARSPEARRAVQSIELQGSAGLLKTLAFVDGQGERTFMRLEPLP
jgi:hypothetical protein